MFASKCIYLFMLLCMWSGAQLANAELKQVETLPTDIPTCRQDDLKINDCIKSAFQSMLPRMKNGIPELNIPSIDPFVQDKIAYDFNTPIVQGRIAMRNVRVFGLTDATVDKVDFKMKDKHVSMLLLTHVPHVYVEGNYKADMKLNDAKLTPKGYFNVTMTDITMRAHPQGELYDRDGHSYLRLTEFDTDPDIGDMRIFATGLFPDPTLNSIVLDFANQNWKHLYKQILPETRSTWEPLMLKGMNEFLAHLPIDLLLTKN